MSNPANEQKIKPMPIQNDLNSYPVYKDSGMPWLGYIPEHWSLQRTKTVLKERSEKGFPDEPMLAATQTKGVVRKEQYEVRTVVAQKDFHLLKLVRVGDFVISLRSFQGGIEYAREQGIISPAYTILYPKTPENHAFFAWLFKSKPYIENLILFVTGIRQGQNIDYIKLGRSALPLPPIAEQTSIVRFLEHADRRIKRCIRAKQKLIKLLNEQKQAIIQQAVTRGLDPNVRLKPSGVEWLGDIPEHWEVSRSRRLFTVRKELARADDVQLSATQAYGVIPQAEFEQKVGRRVVKISMHLEKRGHVEKDDFVISMRSFQGGLERAWTSGAIRSSYIVLKSEPSVDVDFFAYLFKSAGYIGALQATADFIRDGQDLTYDNFRRVDLPLIPTDEQRAIASFISNAISRIDVNISRLSRELEFLREYHLRLIADVVTGKLDVRAAAAQLPDELDEPEPLEAEIGLEEDEEQAETESELSEAEGEE